jgi:hypothetical protein
MSKMGDARCTNVARERQPADLDTYGLFVGASQCQIAGELRIIAEIRGGRLRSGLFFAPLKCCLIEWPDRVPALMNCVSRWIPPGSRKSLGEQTTMPRYTTR